MPFRYPPKIAPRTITIASPKVIHAAVTIMRFVRSSESWLMMNVARSGSVLTVPNSLTVRTTEKQPFRTIQRSRNAAKTAERKFERLVRG